jgi:hypothetical protein
MSLIDLRTLTGLDVRRLLGNARPPQGLTDRCAAIVALATSGEVLVLIAGADARPRSPGGVLDE